MSNFTIDTSAIAAGEVPVFRSAEISENPAVPLGEAAWITDGRESSSGVRITRKAALSYDAVWRAVNLISQTVAKLPLVVYKRKGDGKKRAINHPAYRLLKHDPNPEQTAFTLRQTMQGHALLGGNAYALIERDGSGAPVELVLMDAGKTHPVRENGALWYVTHVRGEAIRLHPDDVLHIHGLGYDGMCGYSVLEMARESLGLGLAARKFGSVFFKNGAKASGVLMYPSKLKPDAIKTLRESWESVHAGVSNQHKLAILEDGVKFQQLTIPPNESQFLETRAFSRAEVANWFQVPPHKIGDASKSSYNSLEQENQAWLDEGLDGWLCNWEGECRKKLLTEREKKSDSHIVEFLRAALLRSNLAVRGAYYRTAVSTGWMSRDEVRSAENLNPMPDGEGAKFLVPLNMGVAGEDEEPAEPADPDAEAKRELLTHTVARMARRLHTHGQRTRGKVGEAQWLATIESDHRETIREALGPVVRLALGADVRADDVALSLCVHYGRQWRDIADVDAWAGEFAASLSQRKE